MVKTKPGVYGRAFYVADILLINSFLVRMETVPICCVE